MKNEMIKFVDENFELIKAQFLKDEMNILEEMFEDEINDKGEFDYLSEFLNKSMNGANSAEELIDVINERSIGVDLDGNEVIELFNMIKGISRLN